MRMLVKGCVRLAAAVGVLAQVTSAAQSPSRPLMDAVKRQDAAAVRALLRQGADPNAREGDGATPLLVAAHQGDLEIVKALLAAHADPKIANNYGITPIYEASALASVPIVERLLAAGAAADAALPEGETPLMVAAKTTSAATARLLLEHGANVNQVEQFGGETAVMYAAANNRAEVVTELARWGADLDARAKQPTLPQRAPMGRFMVIIPTGGLTPLLLAARQGANDAALALIEAGAEPNQASPQGYTPLVLAIVNRHYDTAMTLLAHGADPGNGALYAAVEIRNTKDTVGRWPTPSEQTSLSRLMAELVARGASPDDRSPRGMPARGVRAGGPEPPLRPTNTPLVRACRAADAESVRFLLDSGADATLAEDDGTTPLFAAIQGTPRGFGGMMMGDDETATDTDAPSLAIAKALIEWGAGVDAATNQGQTPMHAAAQRGSAALVKLLAASGGGVNTPDKQGKTPLDYALGLAGGGRGRGGDAAPAGPPPRVNQAAAAALRELGGITSPAKADTASAGSGRGRSGE